jgi:tetratricopeptide (TPR) repeat protein
MAMKYAEAEDGYDSALASFAKVIELTKKTSRALNAQVGIARVYSNQKRYKDAVKLLSELLENPKVSKELSQQLRIQLYDALYRDGQTDKAMEGFEAFAAELPDHQQAPLAIYRVGTILAERKEYDKAQAKLQIVLDRYPACDLIDRVVLSIGEQKANKGERTEAIKYLDAYISKNPDVESAVNFYMKLGELYSKDEKSRDEAIVAFGKIVDVQPPVENSYLSHAAYRQGMLYKEAGNEKKAQAAFEKVRAEDKSVYRASQSEIGKIVAKTNPEEAVKYYGRIIEGAESAEDTIIARIGIGDVYDEIKKYDKAADAFEVAYTKYTGADTSLAAGALVKWVNALMNSKQYNDAVKAANEMQKKYPDNSLTINTYFFEATAYFSLKQFANARKVFEQVIKMNKSAQLTEIAWYQMGDSYYFAQQQDQAIKQYGEYLKHYPKGQYAARAMYMQANCYVSKQDYKGAKGKFLSLLKEYPEFDEACVAKNYLAFSLNKLGDWQSARTYYKQVMNGGCSGETVKFAKEKLEDIKVQNE